jgi:copper resistance protein D
MRTRLVLRHVEVILINSLIVVRDIHFASSVIVAGIFFFDLFIAEPVLQSELRLPATESSFRELTWKIQWLALAASIASALAWLCLLSARIVGKPIDEVIADGTVLVVLSQTQFGFAWAVRFLLAIVLSVFLLLRGKANAAAVWQEVVAALLAGAYLGSLAFAGHGEEGLGFARDIHLAADFLHLVAAGLWLGGLFPLAILLTHLRRFREPSWVTAACKAGSRFSTLGILAVCILLISGMINISFLVGNIQNLTDTPYGRWLLLKLTLVVAMVGLAAINRQYLLPRICGKTVTAQRALAIQTLARSTLIEIAAGLGIIIVIGVLGITAPAIDMTAHVH